MDVSHVEGKVEPCYKSLVSAEVGPDTYFVLLSTEHGLMFCACRDFRDIEILKVGELSDRQGA